MAVNQMISFGLSIEQSSWLHKISAKRLKQTAYKASDEAAGIIKYQPYWFHCICMRCCAQPTHQYSYCPICQHKTNVKLSKILTNMSH